MRRPACLVALATLVLSAPAFAQSYAQVKGMDERFRLDVGGFFQEFDTTFRLDPDTGDGTELSFEDDLGLDSSKTSFRADGYWRFGRRGRIEFAYQSYRRSNDRVLSRQVVIGDTTYDVGADIRSMSRVDVAELYYGWSMINTGEAEVSLLIGASTFVNKWEFEATGAVSGGGGGTSGTFEREESDLVVPVPAIGATARYTLVPGFMLHGRVKWMNATIDAYTGSMLDWRVGLDWYFTKNFGIGAVWTSTEIDLEKERDQGNVAFSYTYDGPLAYLSFTF